MTKRYNYSLVFLAFCGAFTDFLCLNNNLQIYPRDRMIHLFLSYAISIIAAYIAADISLDKLYLRIVLIIAIVLRCVLLFFNMSKYFQIFYGNNTITILIFTFISSILIWNFEKEKFSQTYSFFIIINILMFLLFAVLSFTKVNVVNLYSTNLEFNFSFSKLFLFFDILSLTALTNNASDRLYTIKNYLLLSLVVFQLITLFQGLCVGGNMLYSTTPLQSLIQVFSGKTVKRYDFIFTIFFLINYFAAFMLNIFALNVLVKKERIIEKN